MIFFTTHVHKPYKLKELEVIAQNQCFHALR